MEFEANASLYFTRQTDTCMSVRCQLVICASVRSSYIHARTDRTNFAALPIQVRECPLISITFMIARYYCPWTHNAHLRNLAYGAIYWSLLHRAGNDTSWFFTWRKHPTTNTTNRETLPSLLLYGVRQSVLTRKPEYLLPSLHLNRVT